MGVGLDLVLLALGCQVAPHRLDLAYPLCQTVAQQQPRRDSPQPYIAQLMAVGKIKRRVQLQWPLALALGIGRHYILLSQSDR